MEDTMIPKDELDKAVQIATKYSVGEVYLIGLETIRQICGQKISMNTKDYLIARELKEKLSEVVSVVDLIVFGSRARGDQDEYSDLDVSIGVAALDKELKEKVYDIVWEVGFENFMVILPLIFTSDELNNSPLRSAPIVKGIIEGWVRV